MKDFTTKGRIPVASLVVKIPVAFFSSSNQPMFWRKIDLKLRSFHVKVIAGLIIITVDTTQTESESFTNSGEGDDLAKVAHTRRNGENDEHSGQEI